MEKANEAKYLLPRRKGRWSLHLLAQAFIPFQGGCGGTARSPMQQSPVMCRNRCALALAEAKTQAEFLCQTKGQWLLQCKLQAGSSLLASCIVHLQTDLVCGCNFKQALWVWSLRNYKGLAPIIKNSGNLPGSGFGRAIQCSCYKGTLIQLGSQTRLAPRVR